MVAGNPAQCSKGNRSFDGFRHGNLSRKYAATAGIERDCWWIIYACRNAEFGLGTFAERPRNNAYYVAILSGLQRRGYA
jgi:hypothetical protein